jgi:hypothetical protein
MARVSARNQWQDDPRDYRQGNRTSGTHGFDEVDEEWMEKLSWLLDRSIPIGSWRIGLDPLMGLIPGFGDAAGALISTFIIMQAHRAGVPRATVLRMVANVGIEAAVGAIPVVGDIFDAMWKANTRNMQLYRGARYGLRDSRADWGFLAVIALVLLALFSIPIIVFVLLVQALL